MRGGGAERIITMLSNNMVKRGYEVSFIITHQKKENAYLPEMDPEVNVISLVDETEKFKVSTIPAKWLNYKSRLIGKCEKVFLKGKFQRSKVINYISNNYKNIQWLKYYFKDHSDDVIVAFMYDASFYALLAQNKSNRVIISERGDPQQSINSKTTMSFIKNEFLKNDPTDYNVLKDKDIAEDAYIVSYFVTACEKIVNINKSLYNYRTNRKSISRSYNHQKIDRKNMLFLYRRFVELLPVWEMNDEETLNTIYESCFSNAMYLFRMHYEYANNKQSRKLVMDYNWNSMLFVDVVAEPHKYGNSTTVRLYEMLSDKHYFRLNVWFAKNKMYKLFKKIKKTIKGV